MESIFSNLIAIIIVVAGCYVYYKKLHNALSTASTSDMEDIEKLASELGLTLVQQPTDIHQGGWIHGIYQGVNINIQDHAVLSGRFVKKSVLYEAILNETHIMNDLEVFRKHFLSTISKVSNAPKIQTGHEEIDDVFTIHTTSEHNAKQIFNSPEVRKSFLDLQKLCPNFRLKAGILTLEYDEGILHDHEKMKTRIQALTACARAIMNNPTTPKLLPQPQTVLTPAAISPETVKTIEEVETTHINW